MPAAPKHSSKHTRKPNHTSHPHSSGSSGTGSAGGPSRGNQANGQKPMEERDGAGVPGISKLKASIRQTKRLLAKVRLISPHGTGAASRHCRRVAQSRAGGLVVCVSCPASKACVAGAACVASQLASLLGLASHLWYGWLVSYTFHGSCSSHDPSNRVAEPFATLSPPYTSKTPTPTPGAPLTPGQSPTRSADPNATSTHVTGKRPGKG